MGIDNDDQDKHVIPFLSKISYIITDPFIFFK